MTHCKLTAHALKFLPTISPMPITIPEIPINPLAASPNCVVAPIHVPYTPL